MSVMFQAELVMAKLKTKMTAEEWRKYVHPRLTYPFSGILIRTRHFSAHRVTH